MEGGGGLPALFQKLEKNALILGKNVLILVIYWLSFQAKKADFFLCGTFPTCIVHDRLSKRPNFKKSPLPLKIPGYTLVAFIFVGIRNFLLIIPKFQEEIQSS